LKSLGRNEARFQQLEADVLLLHGGPLNVVLALFEAGSRRERGNGRTFVSQEGCHIRHGAGHGARSAAGNGD
jgi:hypothetical protein